ncbi:hypothetical protein POSPLADRAFT_1137091 [Postia placenta MAD-698-R-SB12]|uniref:Afadin and alpha-actinin-binding-domain-containing protein n=1 Tax=Postia placenta MAD-698-R-SB12 TaxID=670580 RepID=A0A1X6N7V3_9APHY|nr:hypothetical protein POSPLADRAFT_1137091 [Postia placenta MAD-698-R-SB12]OSX64473.1 hypothetical protein POSPLADRAFT_1137091 [Postia placenta MAD-698-R-SB12]
MTTPKKLVHWALDMSFSGFGSPLSDASTEANSSSSLQYINSQLIAHGFTHSPGLSLDGLSKEDTDKVVKCLLGMLGQRVDDMSRTEDLTTKLRTLSYDHERMMSMYQAATERAANAEREMNVHKSRLAATTRSLQSAEAAHKHTTGELQRTRTTLQALRTAHQAELKKLEKEKDRMVDRWSKLADVQSKLCNASSGMRCANAAVIDAPDVQLRGKGQGFLDLALEQAEQARKELYDQNRKLRGLILSAANEMQGVLHATRTAVSPAEFHDDPVPLTFTSLFTMPPTESAGDKLSSLLSSLRESVAQLSRASEGPRTEATASRGGGPAEDRKPHDTAEVERLETIINALRKELDEAQKQASTYAAQTQELFDRFAADERLMQGEVGEMSVDLMTAPQRDEERARLDARFKELDEERKKFTEAAVRLGREKAGLEAERIKFLEEKRTWQVEQILAELPPTPAPTSSLVDPVPQEAPAAAPSPRKSVRKSPRKPRASGGLKKVRVSRRSSGLGVGLGPVSPKKITPPFETEVIPTSPSKQAPAFKTSIALPQPQPPLRAPVFVLPPPSPASSLDQGARLSSSLIPPLPAAFDIPPARSAPSMTTSKSEDSAPTLGSSASAPAPVPSTPVVRRPFPMAKPLAAGHMRHAYSPVKPSPLSRILMLANSPDSPNIDRPLLDALTEDAEEDSDGSPTPAPTVSTPIPAMPPQRSLAAELGITEDDENPLRDREAQANVKSKATGPVTKLTAKGKGKAKAEPMPVSRTRPAVALEKENVNRAKLSSGAASTTGTAQAAPEKKSVKAPPKPFSRSKVAGRPPPARIGPRRVPIDSAEAAHVGPGWKG